MSDTHGHNSGARRGVKFDPTINLGHILTAGAFLFSTVAAWITLDARVTQTAKDLARVEAQMGEKSVSVENRLMREITSTQAGMNQTQVRTADDVREIKTLLRDGFKQVEDRLERKMDKPGR